MKAQHRQGSFEQLMLPHLDAAYNLARWLVREPSLAEDVVQDAYARAWKCFATLRARSSRAWLLQIIHRAAYATLKANRPDGDGLSIGETHVVGQYAVDERATDVKPVGDPTGVRRNGVASLDRALRALPVAWRECLILRDVENVSYEDIAWITDTPIGTVASRIGRAREWLQRGADHDAPDAINADPILRAGGNGYSDAHR